MQYACTDNGDRIKPSYSGERANCRQCGGELTGNCGEIKVWHWRHLNNRDCDSWKESETEWHREWKSHFPEDCQEVLINKDGKCHRADVQLRNKLVIEFQNSSISSTTIREREEFYGNIIWVINAKEFKQNFQRDSVVRRKLDRLDNDVSYVLDIMRKEYDEEIAKRREWIWEVDYQIEKYRNEKEWLISELKELSDFNDINGEKFNCLFNEIINLRYTYQKPFDSFISLTLRDLTVSIKECGREIREETESLTKREDVLVEIEGLEKFEYLSQNYLVAPIARLNLDYFTNIIAINKTSRANLFIDVTQFKSREELATYKNMKDRYDFAINQDHLRNAIIEKVESTRQKLINLQSKKEILKAGLYHFLIEEILNITLDLKKKLEKVDEELIYAKRRREGLLSGLSELEKRKEIEINEYENTAEENNQRERSEIMRKFKGLYVYNWKHERKSWRSSKKKLYFDTGEGYIYKLIDEEWFKKIPKSEFLKVALART